MRKAALTNLVTPRTADCRGCWLKLSDIADRTAQHLGVRFYKKQMNEQSLADRFEDATWHCEQPFADLNYIGTYALSELVREQGFRVLLNGMLHLVNNGNTF
jgi:asparagine synthetase B (glutamine-hydrolysing)